MKTIRMLRNVFVDGQPLTEGQVVSLPSNLADALLAMHRAERVQEQDGAINTAAQPDPETPAAEGKTRKTKRSER